MGQKLRNDYIGLWSQSAGVVSMASSASVPSYLTIGGQQYKIVANLSRTIATDVTMIAFGLYKIYAVNNAGNIELRVSANDNSIGPAGFLSWKLVGAFYANGLTSVAFGSFVTIDGAPRTFTAIPLQPTGTWSSNTTYSGTFSVNGTRIHQNVAASMTGTPNAVVLTMATNWIPDAAQYPIGALPGFVAGVCRLNYATSFMTTVTMTPGAATMFLGVLQVTGGNVDENVGALSPTVPLAVVNGTSVSADAEFYAVGLSAVPLKDR